MESETDICGETKEKIRNNTFRTHAIYANDSRVSYDMVVHLNLASMNNLFS